jgi:lipid A 4'-phosphatase
MDRLKTSPTFWFLPVWILALIPSIDTAISAAFYQVGTGFTWAPNGFLEFVRSNVPELIIGTFAGCVVAWGMTFVPVRWAWRITTPQIVYLALTLLIGPGLIVESALKPYWGRARPKDITEFGGSAAFTPPWQIADQCDKNCSFVSGHAAVAFWVTAYAFLLPARSRPVGLLIGIALGLGVGLVRMMQGAHFFSDIAFAGLIVLLVNETLARVILQRRKTVHG